MRNSKWLLVAGLAIMLMTIACQDQMGSLVPKGDEANTAVTPMGRRYNNAGNWFLFWYETPMVAPGDIHKISIGQDNGQNGSVTVWKDAVNLYVEFQVNEPYWLYETHVDVAKDSAGLKHNKAGNLNPGQFRFQGPNPITPPTRDNIITIPLSQCPTQAPPWAMAALCKVFYVNENGDTVWNTGCGGDDTLPHKKTFTLPDDCVWMTGSKLNQPHSYWKVTLDGTGATGPGQGFNVWDGDWYGWCADEDAEWPGEGAGYYVHLYNSLDPNLPTALQNPMWDNISWLINTYRDSFQVYQGPYEPGYYVYDMANVIWYLMGTWPGFTPGWEPAKTMYEEALAHGDGYVPEHGDYVAVLCVPCDPEIVAQLVFIEVDP